jgi:FkbM family methyltransferase
MIVRHFDVSTPETKPPHDEGWGQAWYGYHRMAKCWSDQMKTEFEATCKKIRASGEMEERRFEVDCFLSVLTDIQRKHVNLFELGAGWGEWCMALAGVIDFKSIPVVPTSYRCLAVEGEPTHYKWIKEHFESQNINGVAVHGVVSNKKGVCRFSVNAAPDNCYGQAIISHSDRTIKNTIWYLYNIIFKSIKVPMYTIDNLIQAYGFEHLDIIDIDVQGAEYKAVLGAADSIKNDLIDYFLIGTHDRELNDSLRQLLSPKYDLVVDIYPDSVGRVDGFPLIRCQDGVQLYKRKNM